MTVILHFQSTGTIPGNAQPFRMTGASMTIGRSDQNDLVLPDPDKVISGRHSAIEDHGGNVVVIDFSTNGTFLNYNKAALGPTPTPLNDGDILSIGTYELLVEIAAGVPASVPDSYASQPDFQSTPQTAGTAQIMDVLDDSSGDDFLDDLLGPSTPVQGHQSVIRDQIGDDGLMPPMGEDDDDLMVPRQEENYDKGESIAEHSSSLEDSFSTPAPATSAIPDDWDLGDLGPIGEPETPDASPLDPFADAPIPPPVVEIPEEPIDVVPIATPPRVEVTMTAQTVAPPPIATGDDRAARAFLNALGEGELSCSDDALEETMERLGNVMRTMILGVREILMTRATIKSEFRINQTMISRGGNNPLKFSVSPEQAIESMVKPTTKGYMDAVAASEQALTDIKAHEVAMMTGMEAALKGVLAKMEPKALVKIIESDRGFRSPLTNKKASYWDGFEHKYQEIVDQAENDFQDLFSNEFAKAYQDQLDRLK